ncbi:MAG: carbohydrate ABC transporter permease [Mycobacterium leprae]
MSRKKQNPLRTAIFYLMVGFVVLLIVFPFLWQIRTSLMPPELLDHIPLVWFPNRLFIDSYVDVFDGRPFLTYIMNSGIVATTTTVVNLTVGAFAAYALARLKFPGKNLVLSLVLAVSMFPVIAIVSPLFLFMRSMHLLNTYASLVLPYTTFAMPLCIWNLTTFFKEIPKELEESAKVDGCTPMQAFRQIILPLTGPGLFTTAILVFISAWNEFLLSLTFNTADSMRTVPVGIAMFQGEHTLPWGDIAAASVIVTIPLIIMVLIFQRRIIAGLTAGAVKG